MYLPIQSQKQYLIIIKGIKEKNYKILDNYLDEKYTTEKDKIYNTFHNVFHQFTFELIDEYYVQNISANTFDKKKVILNFDKKKQKLKFNYVPIAISSIPEKSIYISLHIYKHKNNKLHFIVGFIYTKKQNNWKLHSMKQVSCPRHVM